MKELNKQLKYILTLVEKEVDMNLLRSLDNTLSQSKLRTMVERFQHERDIYLKTGIITNKFKEEKMYLYQQGEIKKYLNEYAKLDEILRYYNQKMNTLTKHHSCF